MHYTLSPPLCSSHAPHPQPSPDSSACTQEALQAGPPNQVVRAVKAVRSANLRAEVAEAEQTNELRSGTRGDHARQHLLGLEATYLSLLLVSHHSNSIAVFAQSQEQP